MLHLLKIDLKKLTSYRTFWVICGLYFFLLAVVLSSGNEFVKWLISKGAAIFDKSFSINRIPLYYFPDIWQNILFVAGLFKMILGIMVVISITNEFAYRTIRQNIIDGMSRWEFLQSKILTNVLLSSMSVVMVFLIGLVTGMIYSPQLYIGDILNGMEFFLAYFIEVLTYLSFALLLGILVNRAGLAIVLLLFSRTIEFFIKVNVPDSVSWLSDLFPLESMTNLVPFPFLRYALQEIQDYVSLSSVLIALVWAFLFNYFAYVRLKKSDI
ncbi:MAG TPA: ABC transporter permease subunit [Cyclobacteriaceae bacterium]|jgi:ABC-type transport system involved in multi-copper enzyme maturation permease subunit|nr:ABC transporter permease subunit [Cyclobacteriaceae bacterium]